MVLVNRAGGGGGGGGDGGDLVQEVGVLASLCEGKIEGEETESTHGGIQTARKARAVNP